MAEPIDYFLTVISPWVYLGHRPLMQIARRHGVPIRFRPVALGAVWQHSGSVPLAQRSPARQRYRFVELQRYAELRGVALNCKPAFFPADASRADLAIAAIVAAGGDPAEFALRCGEAVWSLNRNIADEAVVAELLAATGHDAPTIIEAAKQPVAAAAIAANNAAANAADAIGVPTYVYRGENFWGQDRLDLLDRMIASGRPAYLPL
ncbi:MAG: 2-hydroxychromene-2-carboxylate isomerase [Alphaproteobacteria bacterium]|nr:MAG: 2-hydroxychromene-2-carboxylate isomerase [Alphaproteobacteria bacterium]